MGLAEEEVLIRDDSGLLLDVGETRVPKSQTWSKKLTKTGCLALGFLALGLCVSIPGPTLLDLEDQVKATTFQMMVIFVSRSLGYLLGALLGGVLFDCFDKQLLMFCTLLLSAVATVAIPWSLTMVVMATMFALQGVAMGALDTGGNVFCIQLWGKKNPPFIQTLHFAFGIGAFVAPLLAKPFLSHIDIKSNATSIVQGNIPVAPFWTNNLHTNNISKRSLESFYTELNRPVDDLFKAPLRLKQTSKRDSPFQILNSLQMMKSYEQLKAKAALYEHVGDRLKRQAGDDYTGMWRWKRGHHDSRREATNQITGGPDTAATTTTTTTSSNLEETDKADDNAPESKEDTPKEVRPDLGKVDAGNLEDMAGKSVKKLENPIQVTVPNDTNLKSSTNKTVTLNTTVSDFSKALGNVSVPVNGTDVKTSGSMTTLITTQPTTSEEKVFKKPSAATDSNREPDTADGKPISKHLEEHKDEKPVNTDDDTDNGPVETDNELVSTYSPDLDKETTVNGTLLIGNKTVDNNMKNNNNSSANNSKAEITTHTSNITNSVNASGKDRTTKSALNVSTIKPKEVSEPEVKNETDSSNPGETPKPNVVLESTTARTTTSQKKLTTTTLPSTTSSTTEKATTTSTTTTEKATTTTKTTTKKPTTTKMPTTTKKPATEKVITKAPVTPTKLKTTEPSVKKTTPATKQAPSTKTDKPSIEITPTPESSTNASVDVVSTTNASKTNDKVSTTEVSMKPQSAVDSFLNNAIHAVKNISRIQFAYLSIGVTLFLIAILFLVLYCTDKRRLTPDRDFDGHEQFKSSVTCGKASLIFLLGVFFFCYMGLEVTYGALVTTFAVDYNNWSKEQGAMAAAIFWGSLATGRGLSIFFSRCCGPTIMLVIDMIFMILGGLVLSVGIHFYDKLLWLGTLILGLGMSSAFPAGISWAENYFHLTGKSTAVFVIGSALGQMVVPVITGYLYEYIGSIVLMHTTLALSIMILAIFILMQCVARKKALKVHERNGFLPLEDDDDDHEGNDETLEMDDFIHFDKSQTRLRRDKRGKGDAEYHTLISDLDDD